MSFSTHYLQDELYQQLGQNPALFSFLHEYALDGLWYWDMERPEEEWMSPSFWRTLGFPPEEMPHRAEAWQHLIHPDDLQVALENLEKHLADPSHPYDQVVRYRHREGHTVWVRCRGLAIRNEDGKPIRLLGSHHDISLQMRRKEALRQANRRLERLQALVLEGNDSTWAFDEQGHCLSFYGKMPLDLPIQNPEGKTLGAIGFPKPLRLLFEEALAQGLAGQEWEGTCHNHPRTCDVCTSPAGQAWTGHCPPQPDCSGFRLVAKPFQGQEGPEVLCWLHNTSAEQAAEQALQQQHRLMQAMADSFPHGSISLVGHDLRFRYTGGQGFALYGLNPSDYIGKHVDRLVIPETLNFIRQHLPQVWQGETCRQDVTWGGHTYEVTLCPVMEEQGPSQEVFIILSQNTNEQRLLIEQLRTNEAILEQITQAARVGGWWLEATTRQVYWSDIAREILEVPDDFEPTVESGFDFCATDEYRELGRQAMDQAIASGKGFELEVPMITGKQRPIWVKVMAQTAKTADGHTRLYGAVYDITPLKEGQQQAESANRAKSAFVAHVSHELRTPLNGVVGFADLLIQTPLDREQQLYARSIHDAATLLLGLINDVLDFAKIEAGKLELHEEATSLRKLVQETGNIVWPLAKDKPVRLQTRIGPDLPPWVMVDAIRLRQVLANLLGNALKFTHEGHVTLQIEALPPTEAGHTVRFSVTDTGIGIAPDRLAHIFDAFSQANASTAKHFGGTGLGLSISNRILQLMGSRLQVRSELGKGSTFWFDLLLQPSASVDAYREGGGEPSGPIMLEAFVLVVDDNQVNRSLAMSALRRLMPLARMEAVASGEEALAFMRQQQPDLVFMDIQMPGMNGYDTTRAIRALPNGLKVPIVALTAGTTVGERERCLEAGMNDYATKPVVSATLRHLLLKWMLAMPASQLPKDTHHPPFQFQRLKRLLGPDTHAMDEALATAKRYFDEALLAVKRLEREQATHSLPYLLHDLVEYAQLLDLDELAELSHALLQGQAEPNSIALRRLAQSIGTAQQLLQDA